MILVTGYGVRRPGYEVLASMYGDNGNVKRQKAAPL